MNQTITAATIWQALRNVKDPEIPIVSVVEMGIPHARPKRPNSANAQTAKAPHKAARQAPGEIVLAPPIDAIPIPP